MAHELGMLQLVGLNKGIQVYIKTFAISVSIRQWCLAMNCCWAPLSKRELILRPWLFSDSYDWFVFKSEHRPVVWCINRIHSLFLFSLFGYNWEGFFFFFTAALTQPRSSFDFRAHREEKANLEQLYDCTPDRSASGTKRKALKFKVQSNFQMLSRPFCLRVKFDLKVFLVVVV